MKRLIIISLFVLQTSASFFDVFAPVGNNVAKLMTDVVTDIKETIDCTIYAVERVFSFGGLFGQRSKYYDERCNGQEQHDTSPASPQSEEMTTESTPVKETKDILKKEIDQSVSNASHQIKTILEQSQAKQVIEDVKQSLKDESDRLTKINVILKKEFSGIPENVRQKFDIKQDRQNLQIVLKQVTNTQADSAMAQDNSNSAELDQKQIDAQSSESETPVTTSPPPPVPKTFQEVAKNIMAKTSGSDLQENQDQSLLDQSENEEDVSGDYVVKFNDLFAPLDEKSQKEAVEDAKSIIEQSQQSDAIMNQFFNEDHSSAASAFDNPDFFNLN